MHKKILSIGITLIAVLSTLSCGPGESELEFEFSSPFRNVTLSHLFSSAVTYNTMDAKAHDLDGDGDLDLVLAIEFRQNVILINDGDGILTDESDERLPDAERDTEDIAIADFDNDGDPDIMFVNEDDTRNEYYINDGQGFFSDQTNKLPLEGISNAVEVTDLNNDLWPDLIIGNRGQNFILINDQQGGFIDETDARLPAAGDVTQDIELADFDQDGDLDIFEANENQNRILVNNGDGVFSDQTAQLLPEFDDETREVDLGDIDGDGDLDIIYANLVSGFEGDPQNRLLTWNGSAFFESTGQLPPAPVNSADADFFDLDGDGDLDLLSGNANNGPFQVVLTNDGTGNFLDATGIFFPNINLYVHDFEVADFNGDGKEDIYFANYQGADGYVFNNIVN